MVSIIIPSRNAEFLQRTIDDLLKKAKGDIEIIVVLDGYWPTPQLFDDKRLIVLHHGEVHGNKGMRFGINSGIAISKGEFLMKLDEHCIVDEGFDQKLIADCDDNWVVIPRRYRIDWEKWDILHDGRPPVDYMYLAYPYERPFDRTCGLHGAEWRERYYQRKDILIDDTMSWQGSCWFMTRKHWDWLGPLDREHYGPFTQEAQEIGNKTWLGGGRLVINKKTWYAHYHKGNHGKNYGFSNAQYAIHMNEMERGRLYCIDYWVNNRWPQRVHDFEWLLEKFWPVPTWPENWKERIEQDKLRDYQFAENKKTYG